MNKHRYVDTCFWDDSYIMKLDPSEKLLFMYLLTNPLTNICGIYQIEIKRMAFDTGFDPVVITTILERLEKDDKCAYRDGWIAMKNWIKHQNRSPKVQTGIEIQLKEVPEPLKKFIKGYGIDTISHLNSNSNSNSNLVSTPIARKRETSSAPKVYFNPETQRWDNITENMVALWERAYPACDMERELTKMAAWILSNPKKGKKSNYSKFITNWLSREQDKGGTR